MALPPPGTTFSADFSEGKDDLSEDDLCVLATLLSLVASVAVQGCQIAMLSPSGVGPDSQGLAAREEGVAVMHLSS